MAKRLRYLWDEKKVVQFLEANPHVVRERTCGEIAQELKERKLMAPTTWWHDTNLGAIVLTLIRGKKYQFSDQRDLAHFRKRMSRILSLRQKGKTLAEIGEMLGVTRERVRQLEKKAKRRQKEMSR